MQYSHSCNVGSWDFLRISTSRKDLIDVLQNPKIGRTVELSPSEKSETAVGALDMTGFYYLFIMWMFICLSCRPKNCKRNGVHKLKWIKQNLGGLYKL